MLKKGILNDRLLGGFFILMTALSAYAGCCNAAYAVSTPHKAATTAAHSPASTPEDAAGNIGARYNVTMSASPDAQVKSAPLIFGTSENTAPQAMDSIAQGMLTKEEDRLVVDIKYPITGNQLIDLELFTWANGQMQTFVSAVRGFKEDDGNASFEYSLDIDCKVFHTARIFSVIFNTSTYTGGAHPSDGQISFVFKLEDASRLRFSDIFQADDKSIATLLAKLCYAELKGDLGKLGLNIEEDAIPAELDNFAAFVIDKAGLIIFFEPYQVAPYSFGYQTVSIPLKDLDTLNPRMELW